VYKLKCRACGHVIVLKGPPAGAPAAGATPRRASPPAVAPPPRPAPTPVPTVTAVEIPPEPPPAPAAAPEPAPTTPPVPPDELPPAPEQPLPAPLETRAATPVPAASAPSPDAEPADAGYVELFDEGSLGDGTGLPLARGPRSGPPPSGDDASGELPAPSAEPAAPPAPALARAHLAGERVHHRLERRAARVHHHRVVRRPERRDLALRVLPVALQLVGEDLLEAGGIALRLQLGVAPPRPLLGRRDQEELGVGVREDHRADVAPLEHRPAVLGGERQPALQLEQPGPHHRPRRHLARPERHGGRPDLHRDVLLAEEDALAAARLPRGREADGEQRHELAQPVVVVERDPAERRRERHGPVDGARVHHGEPEPRGELAGGGGLARAGRPVDRDDEGAVRGGGAGALGGGHGRIVIPLSDGRRDRAEVPLRGVAPSGSGGTILSCTPPPPAWPPCSSPPPARPRRRSRR
jgi:hypothetical protein